ncbi:hypothetical protein KZJ38_25070 [Paraburkholderia edwinii]|jgi:hypothetical protein|uniref:Uncharacterized protein n=1 Tax=Paraburkholderia edwinii TaxID=2861782 RepID=A0ABX8V137_9BURK|nr:hypothetical protein [Paraburkholderia edwinii]QYD72954.1 hypothetical protein KZJ38_25070 [Paraburkholderia edwinii]
MRLLVAIVVLLMIPLDAIAGTRTAAPAEIEKAIRQHVIKLQATEYRDARTVIAQNGIVVVIYTIEGACAGINPRAKPGTCSNNWVRYMVALSNHRITPPAAIGGNGGLSDTGVKISDGIIEVSGISAGPNDAASGSK